MRRRLVSELSSKAAQVGLMAWRHWGDFHRCAGVDGSALAKEKNTPNKTAFNPKYVVYRPAQKKERNSDFRSRW